MKRLHGGRFVGWVILMSALASLMALPSCARAAAGAGKLPSPDLRRSMSAQEQRDFLAQVDLARRQLKETGKIEPAAMHNYVYGAAAAHDPELLGIIKKCGGDLNARDPLSGMTPLHQAVSEATTTSVKLLLDFGADPNLALAQNGSTPLYDAVNLNQPEMVRLLLEHKADPSPREKIYGFTPLHSAATEGQIEIGRELVRRRGLLGRRHADLNARNSRGVTPLHLAATGGRLAFVELLLRAGADPNARTAVGTTPLATARASGHANVAALLEKHGGKP